MALRLQELQQREAMVNPDGTPSQYFLRYLKSRGGALTDLEASLLLKADKATQVIAGAGLDGGGTLDADVTLSANEQEILDAISSTHGAILYRGASDWVVLAPGTAGKVLTTNGASSDPTWETVSGGGGSSIAHCAPLPRATSASSTGQATKGIQFDVDIDFDIYGVRTHMTAKSGATYVASIWTMSGSNLGTNIATSSAWVGAATAEELHEIIFSGGPYTLSAGTTYAVLITATSEVGSYVFPMYSTTNSSYFANVPARGLVYSRAAVSSLSAGQAMSTGSGNYSVALLTG